MKPLISIVIVTYKSHNLIKGCLNSILNYNDLDPADIEIIIVDNSPIEYFSTMEECIKDYKENNILLIHNEKNGGYGQGNNIGIKYSSGKLLLIINPDVELTKPIFKSALKQFNNNKRLAILGGKQIGGSNISYYIRQEYDYHVITAYLNVLLNILEIYNGKFMFLSGALMFIDKAKFVEIGLYDENIFMYSEESDITNRFLINGYSSDYSKDLIYLHLINHRETSENSLNNIINSNVYYFKKYNFNINSFFKQKIISFSILSVIFYFFNRKKSRRFAKMKSIYHTKYDTLNNI